MDISKLNYSFFIFICICLLTIFIKKIITRVNKPASKKIYIALLASAIIYLFTELFWNLYEIGYVYFHPNICTAINEAFFISSTFVTVFFMWYAETNLNEILTNHKWFSIITMIPAIFITILVLSTPWTKLIFWMDEKGIYHRGRWVIIHLIVCFFYGGISFFHLAAITFRKENYAYRKKLLSTLFCSGTIILFCFLQQLIPNLPLNAAGILIGVIVEYINVAEFLISLDPLTKINNKNQLFTYLHDKLKNVNEEVIFYLLIIDMDNFKKINDQYGHLEGDQAILRVAEALKMTFSEKNSIICRYGGDEFIASGECNTIEDIKLLKNNFEVTLQRLNQNAKSKYPLEASIGTAVWKPTIKTIPDFIEAADQDLYRIKKERKRIRLR